MTPEAHEDDDRTVIRPAESNPGGGFQRTEWSSGAAAGSDASNEKTVLGATPGPFEPDMGGNLPVGTRLAEFEITSLIGEGGFGIVYLAHDHSLQRRVALKEYMPTSLAARTGGSQVQVKSPRHRETFEAGLKSFINEARLLASFDHPSLVKVYRFWEANGTAYMVMPFLEGTTLKDVLRRLGQTPDEAWLRSVLGPLSEALLVIHAEQCYHRDIAPDNVMLLPSSNRWLLLDFGAARRVIGDMTQALTVILKPGYAPVEQYAEIPGMKQGAWTDVYALAAVVYFAIMGRTPPPSVGRLLNDTYVPLTEAAAGRYSERFLAAVDRALAVRPEQRTQSVGEFRADMGLGDPAFDTYSTTPLPPGMDVPSRRASEATVLMPNALAPTAIQTLAAPPPQPAVATRAYTAAAAPPAAAAVAAPPASRKGLALGVGLVALGALGFGAYAVLSPSPRPPVPPKVVPQPDVPPPGSKEQKETPPVPATFDVSHEFERLVQAQTPGFGLKAQAPKSQLHIGRDDFQFTLQSEREGYLYVFAYASDGTLAQLVPNSVSGTVRIRKGQSWRFPTGDGFVIESQEPPGLTQLLLMVSTRQRNHDALQPRREGPVRVFPTGEAAALARQSAGPGSILAGKVLCPPSGACEEDYGAVVLRYDTLR
jgi:serine/threonine protein kinase